MLKILHFADAHIDMANYGRHDPKTGMPQRTLDFLRALDVIVDTAISEKVDLVLFAGDAYKDRTPVPTFQREWGQRMMRLSNAGIPTLMLIGNHDLSPASGRAHALQEYETLRVPHISVISRPSFLGPEDLEGLPLQILALPWVSRSGVIADQEMSIKEPGKIYAAIEERLISLVEMWLSEKVSTDLPVILTAHASVQGAKYGFERSVMLGRDLVLPPSLVRDSRLNYVALGHIHKAQDVNPQAQPPVIYPGSIERVDFGEIEDGKFFVIAHVGHGEETRVDWHELPGRQFFDCQVKLTGTDGIQEKLLAALPSREQIADAIVRLTIDYPGEWETMIDESAIRHYAENAFEFRLERHRQMDPRLVGRLGNKSLATLTPLDLLDLYWSMMKVDPDEARELQNLVVSLLATDNQGMTGE